MDRRNFIMKSGKAAGLIAAGGLAYLVEGCKPRDYSLKSIPHSEEFKIIYGDATPTWIDIGKARKAFYKDNTGSLAEKVCDLSMEPAYDIEMLSYTQSMNSVNFKTDGIDEFLSSLSKNLEAYQGMQSFNRSYSEAVIDIRYAREIMSNDAFIVGPRDAEKCFFDKIDTYLIETQKIIDFYNGLNADKNQAIVKEKGLPGNFETIKRLIEINSK
jgi:hypothetical protein